MQLPQLIVIGLALAIMSCGANTSGGSTTSGWVVKNRSGSSPSGSSFISPDDSPQLSSGGVTQGLTAGDFSISFFDINNGWFVGNLGEVLLTNNGGATAARLDFTTSSGTMRAVAAVSSTNVYVGGGDTTLDGYSIFFSGSSGVLWSVQANTGLTNPNRSAVSVSADQIRAFSFLNTTTGYVVGGYGDNTGFIWKTINGSSWTQVYNAAVVSGVNVFTGVAFPSANVTYAVGFGGVILKTSDSGNSWSQLTSGTTENLQNITCSNVLSCLVVGNSGTVLTTSDGGSTWTAQTSGTSANLFALSSTSSSNFWAGGSGGVIIYSSDGGVTWTAQTSNTTFQIEAITMVNSNVGWAVAVNTGTNTGAILYTSSGGQ